MSLRSVALVWIAYFAIGCGGPRPSDDPTTAKEKQRRDAEASEDLDAPGKKGGGWRYKGDRNACFFLVGSKCFKAENAACQAAKCKAPKRCRSDGAGPAQVSCK